MLVQSKTIIMILLLVIVFTLVIGCLAVENAIVEHEEVGNALIDTELSCGNGSCEIPIGENGITCPVDCGGITQDCGTPGELPSCSDTDIARCVCEEGSDSYCCKYAWDEFCAKAKSKFGCDGTTDLNWIPQQVETLDGGCGTPSLSECRPVEDPMNCSEATRKEYMCQAVANEASNLAFELDNDAGLPLSWRAYGSDPVKYTWDWANEPNCFDGSGNCLELENWGQGTTAYWYMRPENDHEFPWPFIRICPGATYRISTSFAEENLQDQPSYILHFYDLDGNKLSGYGTLARNPASAEGVFTEDYTVSSSVFSEARYMGVTLHHKVIEGADNHQKMKFDNLVVEKIAPANDTLELNQLARTWQFEDARKKMNSLFGISPAPEFYTGWVDSSERVFLEDFPFSVSVSPIHHLTVFRGESEAVQLAIVAGSISLNNVRLELVGQSPIANSISIKSVAHVNNVNCDGFQNTPYPEAIFGYGSEMDEKWWPDPIIELTSFDLAAHNAGSFWIEIDTSTLDSSGLYPIKLSLSADEISSSVELTLWVNVSNIGLSADWRLKKVLSWSGKDAQHIYGIDAGPGELDGLDNFHDYFVSNRIGLSSMNCGSLFDCIPESTLLDALVEGDQNVFLAGLATTYCKKTVDNADPTALDTDTEFFGFPDLSEKSENFIYKLLSEHSDWIAGGNSASADLTDKAIFYGFDENFAQDFGETEDFSIPQQTFEKIAEHTGIRTASTFKDHTCDDPSIVDPISYGMAENSLDIYIPLERLYDFHAADKIRKSWPEKEIWWYSLGLSLQNSPGNYRSMFHNLFRVGADGYLFYRLNRWKFRHELGCYSSNTINPECFQAPLPVGSGTILFDTDIWDPCMNEVSKTFSSDNLIYPGPNQTAITSQRLANIKDGIEDYDLFSQIAEKLVDNNESGIEDIHSAKRFLSQKLRLSRYGDETNLKCWPVATIRDARERLVEFLWNDGAEVAAYYLVGHWSFDQYVGSLIKDNSGYGNHGTMNNPKPLIDSGVIIKAAEFDQDTNWFQIPLSATTNFADSDFTVSVWFNVTGMQDTHGIIGQGKPYQIDGEGWVLYYNADVDEIRLKMNNGNGSPLYHAIAVGAIENEWHHLVAIFDRDENLTMYLDGIELGRFPISSKQGGSFGTDDIYVGRFGSYTGSDRLVGLVDELKLYERILNKTQVEALYTPAVAGWKLDWEYSLVVEDDTSNGHDGFLGGDVYVNGAVGHDNGSAVFDGDRDFIEVLHTSDMDFSSSDFSVHAWIMPTMADGNGAIIGKGDPYKSGCPCSDPEYCSGTPCNDEGRGVILYYDADYSELRLKINNGYGQPVYKAVRIPSILNEWHHIAATFDRDGSAIFYLDGLPVGEVDISSKANGTLGEEPYFLGRFGNYIVGGSFEGHIDEVGVHKNALSADQIKALYYGYHSIYD